MLNRNKYGLFSGGYIFDTMDRTALDVILKKYRFKKDWVLTAEARINFIKTLRHNRWLTTKTEIDCTGNYYYVYVELWQQQNIWHKHKDLIASGSFIFKHIRRKNA